MPIGSDIFENSDSAKLSNDLLFVAETSDDSDEEEDNPRDLDYVPSTETPIHRTHKNEPRDSHLAARSAAVAKHPGRCAFTGEQNVCATVQYAHGTARHIGYTRPELVRVSFPRSRPHTLLRPR